MAISLQKSIKIHEQRREQILKAAQRLFDENGFSNTRIIDISNKAGISKGLIYHYFQSKEEILLAFTDAMNECLDELLKMESPIDSLTEFAVRLLTTPKDTDYIPPLRIFVTIAVKGELDPARFRNPIAASFGREYFTPIFQRGQLLGQFREGNAEEFADFYWHFLLGCLVEYLQCNGTQTIMPDLNAILGLFQ